MLKPLDFAMSRVVINDVANGRMHARWHTPSLREYVMTRRIVSVGRRPENLPDFDAFLIDNVQDYKGYYEEYMANWGLIPRTALGLPEDVAQVFAQFDLGASRLTRTEVRAEHAPDIVLERSIYALEVMEAYETVATCHPFYHRPNEILRVYGGDFWESDWTPSAYRIPCVNVQPAVDVWRDHRIADSVFLSGRLSAALEREGMLTRFQPIRCGLAPNTEDFRIARAGHIS